MDFGITDEQAELSALARRILEDRVTPASLQGLERDGGERFDPDLWAELARADVLGVALPEDVGGAGYGFFEQCLVLEEVGRVLAPVPLLASIVMGAMPIAHHGTPDQRERWVRPAAGGERILTAALAEPLNRDRHRPRTTATRDGSRWRIDGVKTGVPAATLADLVLVPAATGDEVRVFLLDPGADGVAVEAQQTTSRDTFGRLELSGVVLGDDAVLGGGSRPGGEILAWMLERATVGLCAQQLGVTERALADTARYTRDRVQFDRPIATFQAVGHRCADAYIDVEGIRLTTWQAAWRLAEGLPASLEVETAKFWAAEGGHRVGHAVVHLHGGMGVANEHTIHRYFLHAKQHELMLGGATEQALRIGTELAATPA